MKLSGDTVPYVIMIVMFVSTQVVGWFELFHNPINAMILFALSYIITIAKK